MCSETRRPKKTQANTFDVAIVEVFRVLDRIYLWSDEGSGLVEDGINTYAW